MDRLPFPIAYDAKKQTLKGVASASSTEEMSGLLPDNSKSEESSQGNFWGKKISWISNNKAKALVYVLVPTAIFCGGYAAGSASKEAPDKNLLTRNASELDTTKSNTIMLNPHTTNYGDKSQISTLSPETVSFIEDAISQSPSFLEGLTNSETPDWYKTSTTDSTMLSPNSNIPPETTSSILDEPSLNSNSEITINGEAVHPHTTNYGDKSQISTSSPETVSFIEDATSQYPSFLEGLTNSETPGWSKTSTTDSTMLSPNSNILPETTSSILDEPSLNSYSEITINGEAMLCPNNSSLPSPSNTTQPGSQVDKTIFNQEHLGKCSDLNTDESQLSCFQETLRISCRPWVEASYRRCSDITHCPLGSLGSYNYAPRHPEYQASRGIRYGRGYVPNDILDAAVHDLFDQSIYGSQNVKNNGTLVIENFKPNQTEINQQLNNNPPAGLNCRNGTALVFKPNSKVSVNHYKNHKVVRQVVHNVYIVDGLKQCNANIPELCPKTSALCRVLPKFYNAYKVSSEFLDFHKQHDKKLQYIDQARNQFYKEVPWTKDRQEALSSADFKPPQILPAFVKGECTPVDNSIT